MTTPHYMCLFCDRRWPKTWLGKRRWLWHTYRNPRPGTCHR